MYRVGAREFKQHTGEIIERVRKGERVVLTLRGVPVAVISPLDPDALEKALSEEAKRAEKGSLGWLVASESGGRAEDEVWQISHQYLEHIGAMSLAENNYSLPADETARTLTEANNLRVSSSNYIIRVQ